MNVTERPESFDIRGAGAALVPNRIAWRGRDREVERVPGPDELRHLAFHGHAEHVHAIFRTLARSTWGRHADSEVLRQVVVGSRARLRRLSDAPAHERQEEFEFLESVVRVFVATSCERRSFPRDLFRTLLEWSDELVRASRLSDALACCEQALALGVDAFPDLWPWVQLRRAGVLVLCGDLEQADATLAETYGRLDLVADRNAIPALLRAFGHTSLQTGQATRFKRLLFDSLRLFHTKLDERREAVRLLRRVFRGGVRLLVSREVRPIDRALFAWHSLCLGAADALRWPRLSRAFERLLIGAVYVQHYGWRRDGIRTDAGDRASRHPAILVTRAMGGLGDLLMMTPGLRALKAKHTGRQIVLAVPRRFMPLFHGNDDVQVVDIGGRIAPSSFRRWFNLTDCPAARTESRTAPRVRTNRIDLFARALGTGGRRLRQMDRRPRYVVSASERAWRDRFFAEHGLTNRPVVGVQQRTDEAYRDVPHMDQIVKALTAHATVLLFGPGLRSLPDHPRVLVVDGLDVRLAFALASGCDVLVAPDSAFLHLAGALDLPCVGLFGPTDGRVRARDYPNCRPLDARRTLRCVPCWRNEDTPCGLTGLRSSACLGEIEPAEVVSTVTQMLSDVRQRSRRAS